MKPVWTYDLEMAASRDAANRSMRAAGRTHWSVEDWNVACAVFDRLYPATQEPQP